MSCIRDVAFSFDQVICTMNISFQEEFVFIFVKNGTVQWKAFGLNYATSGRVNEDLL